MTAEPPRRPWSEAVATFFTTLALGPPIGGLVFTVCVALYPSMGALAGHAVARGDASSALLVMIFVGLFAVPFSYLVGGVQAAVAGLALAAFGWQLGRPPLWFAAVLGLLIYAGALLSGYNSVQEWFIPFLLIHVIPVLACWSLVRLFWRPQLT
jgi:hypothetical protein